MANVQRLTKRVKDLEEWIKENEMTGGPQGTLEVFTYLVNEARGHFQRATQTDQAFHQLRQFVFEFVQQHELTKEWDEFIKDKENAVQEQSPAEIPALTKAEDGEEVGKGNTKRKKPSKKSNKEKKD
jgi:hypothetical protein